MKFNLDDFDECSTIGANDETSLKSTLKRVQGGSSVKVLCAASFKGALKLDGSHGVLGSEYYCTSSEDSLMLMARNTLKMIGSLCITMQTCIVCSKPVTG